MEDTYPFLPPLAPTDMIFTAYYPWVIWFVTMIACIIGKGRMFEGPKGEILKEKPKEK